MIAIKKNAWSHFDKCKDELNYEKKRKEKSKVTLIVVAAWPINASNEMDRIYLTDSFTDNLT